MSTNIDITTDIIDEAAPAHAQGIGDAIEAWSCDEFTLERNSGKHADARLGPRPVQVKGTKARIKNGVQDGVQKFTKGRFRLYETDHEHLLQHDGLYALVVYEYNDDDEAVAVHAALVTATQMDRLLPDDPWYDLEALPRKHEGSSYRLPWTRIFAGGDR